MNEGPPACPIPRWTLLKQELRNVGPAEFDNLRAKAPAGTVLDVRAPAEFDAFHLDGAVNMNYLGPDFLEQMEDTVLLDVRTPAETAGGVIEGAIEMDYRASDFAQKVSELDPDKTYLVYCASGGRSGKTCGKLNEMGFAKVYNLKGGYSAWKQ